MNTGSQVQIIMKLVTTYFQSMGLRLEGTVVFRSMSTCGIKTLSYSIGLMLMPMRV
jgi:hypothetical protein